MRIFLKINFIDKHVPDATTLLSFWCFSEKHHMRETSFPEALPSPCIAGDIFTVTQTHSSWPPSWMICSGRMNEKRSLFHLCRFWKRYDIILIKNWLRYSPVLHFLQTFAPVTPIHYLCRQDGGGTENNARYCRALKGMYGTRLCHFMGFWSFRKGWNLL